MIKRQKSGFTIAELLIVVAIISVLAVLAISIYSSSLEASREATDIGNMRNAKALGVAKYLEDNENADNTYLFDAEKGLLVASTEKVKGYGQGTDVDGGKDDFYMSSTEDYTSTTDVDGKIIQVSFTEGDADTDVLVELSWVAATE